jgi:hypothetical protein
MMARAKASKAKTKVKTKPKTTAGSKAKASVRKKPAAPKAGKKTPAPKRPAAKPVKKARPARPAATRAARSKPVKAAQSAKAKAKTKTKLTRPKATKTDRAPKATKASRAPKATKASRAPKAAKKVVEKKAAPRKTIGKVAKPAAESKKAAPKAPAVVEVVKKKVGIADVKASAARTNKTATKRGRKRQRVTPTSTPLANWIPKDGRRPSSFLPAPPRAQSAFTVAAAPASSDRLVREEDLAPPAPIRTIPVLVNVVQEGGWIEVRTNPEVVEAAPGDAVEWDFRYSGGADVLVTQVLIEIDKPSPFGKTSYKSAKPGAARPHRQVSDLVKEKSLGTSTRYTIHCTNAYKTELAKGNATIVVRTASPSAEFGH